MLGGFEYGQTEREGRESTRRTRKKTAKKLFLNYWRNTLAKNHQNWGHTKPKLSVFFSVPFRVLRVTFAPFAFKNPRSRLF